MPAKNRNVQAQRAVVLQILFGESDIPGQKEWTREEIKEGLSSLAPSLIDDALSVLAKEGVILIQDLADGEEDIGASPCVKHLISLCLLTV